jgi:hypothetical protein
MTSRKHKRALRNLQMISDSLVESPQPLPVELEQIHNAYGLYLISVRKEMEALNLIPTLSEAVSMGATGVWKDNVVPLHREKRKSDDEK